MKGWLETKTTKEKLILLSQLLEKYQENNRFPNIFTHERILICNTFEPIHKELSFSRHLIYKNPIQEVETLENNEKNFLTCFFGTDPSDSSCVGFKYINEKYIKNLDAEIDRREFILKISNQLSQIDGDNDDHFILDILAASSLYECQSDSDIQIKIDRFVNQYHKFHNDIADRHIYGIDEETVLLNENPDDMLRTVQHSLSIIREKSIPSLLFYLDKDVEDYRLKLEGIVSIINNDLINIKLSYFKRIYPHVLHVHNAVTINGTEFNYENIVLLHTQSEQLQEFTIDYASYVRSAEYIYGFSANGKYYLVIILSAISKIYRSIEDRLKTLFNGEPTKSYRAVNVFPDRQPELLDYFDRAIANIAIHRDISDIESKAILKKWLGFLPSIYHQRMVTLLAAHVVINKEEINSFLIKVKSLMTERCQNPFLIKRLDDMGGTERLLLKDSTILRKMSSFNPSKIEDGSQIATIVVENILSGSQILSAMKYYLGIDEYSVQTNHFQLDEHERLSLTNKLKNLTTLNICTVLYSPIGVNMITEELNKILGIQIEINIIHGRNINGDAWFGTTSQIGENDKSQIRNLLCNTNEMKIFRAYFKQSRNQQIKTLNVDTIKDVNLVARYQSLPKKAFSFLSIGLRADSTCHPLVRIPEACETKNKVSPS